MLEADAKNSPAWHKSRDHPFPPSPMDFDTIAVYPNAGPETVPMAALVMEGHFARRIAPPSYWQLLLIAVGPPDIGGWDARMALSGNGSAWQSPPANCYPGAGQVRLESKVATPNHQVA